MAHDPISPSFMKEKWGDHTIRVLYYHTRWRSFSRQCVTEKGIRITLKRLKQLINGYELYLNIDLMIII